MMSTWPARGGSAGHAPQSYCSGSSGLSGGTGSGSGVGSGVSRSLMIVLLCGVQTRKAHTGLITGVGLVVAPHD